MASIGKFALNLLSGEAAFALANINFDFSVVKMEAPAEYKELGNTLSKKRKFEAEEGIIHSTARKLGALFGDDIPEIPNLSRAYGLRASEVAANKDVNPQAQTVHGPMLEYIGADGTAIWAAATSGRGAVQAHLLACMLARMWSASEATSILVEMVATRKAILARRTEGSEFNIQALAASRIEIPRADLAKWDASARSVSSRKPCDLKGRIKLTLSSLVSGYELRTLQKPCSRRN
jgi:hypothetical protein